MQTRPNILFIMADQFRFDATGVTGGWARTPNLDRIASSGVTFRRCYTNSPVCVPARVSLATGLYPHNTNVWNNIRYDLPARYDTWTQLIRSQGYQTSVFGKTHLHSHSCADIREKEDIIHNIGFDVVDEIVGPRACMKVKSSLTDLWEREGFYEAYRSDYQDRFARKPFVARPSVLPVHLYADVYVAQRAIEYLSGYKGDDPWFCWLSFGGPHEPWDAPEPYASMYSPAEMPKPVRPNAFNGDRPRGHLDQLMTNSELDPASRMISHDIGPVHAPDFDADDIAEMRANYAGNVTLIDDQIGEVMRTIAARGELDNTVIVFTSDHGEMNGDYGLIYKENFLDPAAKVPLIISTPATSQSASAGSICDALVELIDVGPTLVELSGGSVDYRQFGRSITPTLKDVSIEHRTDALLEIWGEYCIVDGGWKMAVNRHGLPYMLFNLHTDPNEQDNVVANPELSHVLQDLQQKILQRIVGSHTNEG